MSENVSPHHLCHDRSIFVVGLSCQNIFLWRFSGKSKGSEGVHDQVHPEHLDSSQRRVLQNNRSKENNEHCSNIDRQLELKEFSDIIVDVSSVSESNDDRTEVVIKKDNIRSIFGNICSAYIHGETDISLCQSRSIV